jgi:hypothetical protein
MTPGAPSGSERLGEAVALLDPGDRYSVTDGDDVIHLLRIHDESARGAGWKAFMAARPSR